MNNSYEFTKLLVATHGIEVAIDGTPGTFVKGLSISVLPFLVLYLVCSLPVAVDLLVELLAGVEHQEIVIVSIENFEMVLVWIIVLYTFQNLLFHVYELSSCLLMLFNLKRSHSIFLHVTQWSQLLKQLRFVLASVWIKHIIVCLYRRNCGLVGMAKGEVIIVVIVEAACSICEEFAAREVSICTDYFVADEYSKLMGFAFFKCFELD